MMKSGYLTPRWTNRRSATFNWGEVSRGWGLALELMNFSSDDGGYWSLHFQLIYGKVYIRLPFLGRREPHPDMMLDGWGFSWRWDADSTSAIHLRWGHRGTILHLPWAPTWVRTSILLRNMRWDHELRRKMGEPTLERAADFNLGEWQRRRDYLAKHRWEEKYPFTYVLKSGEVQKRIATVSVEEREWRWRWLTWLPAMRKARGFWWPEGDRPAAPIFGRVQRTISVEFNDEVGESSGSWKGGVLGCGCEMRSGELPVQTLRRMEKERKL